MLAIVKTEKGLCPTLDVLGRRIPRDNEGFFHLTDAEVVVLRKMPGVVVEPKEAAAEKAKAVESKAPEVAAPHFEEHAKEEKPHAAKHEAKPHGGKKAK